MVARKFEGHSDFDKITVGGQVPAGVGAPEAAIADFVAITGGEPPTESEFNALGAKLNSVLAALRAKNIIAT